MNGWFRTLALCLLMASLPLQGMAASLRLTCSPEHHAGHSQAAPVTPASPLTHPQGMTGLSDHHTMRASPAAQADCDAGHGSDRCCSAMCSVAGLVPAAWRVRLSAAVSTLPTPTSAQIYQGVTPKGLDRPPKSPLV